MTLTSFSPPLLLLPFYICEHGRVQCVVCVRTCVTPSGCSACKMEWLPAEHKDFLPWRATTQTGTFTAMFTSCLLSELFRQDI